MKTTREMLRTLAFFAGTVSALVLHGLYSTRAAHIAPGPALREDAREHPATADRLQLLERHVESLREQIHQANLRLYYEREKERAFVQARNRAQAQRSQKPKGWGTDGEWEALALNIALEPGQESAVRAALTEYFNRQQERLKARVRGLEDPFPNLPTLEQTLAPQLTPLQMADFAAYLEDRRQVAVDQQVSTYMSRSLALFPMDEEQQMQVEAIYREEARQHSEQNGLTFRSSIAPAAIASPIRGILTPEQFALWERVVPF